MRLRFWGALALVLAAGTVSVAQQKIFQLWPATSPGLRAQLAPEASECNRLSQLAARRERIGKLRTAEDWKARRQEVRDFGQGRGAVPRTHSAQSSHSRHGQERGLPDREGGFRVPAEILRHRLSFHPESAERKDAGDPQRHRAHRYLVSRSILSATAPQPGSEGLYCPGHGPDRAG